jgi:RNA polymerase sigma-70 factor (ECF subfamily)
MYTTSVSLLERLRQPSEQEAWSRFVKLYTPLLYSWSRRVGLGPEDAADLVEEVLLVLVQKLPGFAYDPEKSFRGWLRTVTRNKWREQRRRRALPTAGPTDPPIADLRAPETDDFDEFEYRRYLVGRALKLMQQEFEPTTWKACWECVVGSRPAAAVAAELGMSVNAVYLAKSRVLRRLHQELKGLLE